ncbi:MAG: heterodisulfide reductase-related iron-sulfur binding cluster [Planctomycetota bacterium]
MYVLLLPTVAVAGYGIYRRIRRWNLKRGCLAFDRVGARISMLLRNALFQQRTLRDAYAGTFHAFLFWGMIVLTIATTVVMIQADFGIPIMQGNFYLYFQSFTVDVFGALVLVGLGMAAVRRWIAKPRKLVYTDEASWILVALFVISATGFLLEGWRIAVTDDPWGVWSPFGYLIARLSVPLLGVETMRIAHVATWWFHLVLVFAFFAWAPYTKMFHVLSAPLNIFTASLEPIGASLPPIDFENIETLGVKTLAEFTSKDYLDFDACTECGRCTSVCPANAVGKSLSPRDIILDLRGLLHEWDGKGEAPAIHGARPALSADAFWECTTCAACMEACPVSIEQMPKIVGARRYLVMEEAEFPPMMQEALQSLESRGHPFRGTRFSRVDWFEGLELPNRVDPQDAEILLWVGCGGALIERNQKVTRAFAQLLSHAGIKFAILGREEKCSGDPAKRIGNEFLFETIAKENIEQLDRQGIRKVVTACPHCFNTFKNEYPRLGATLEVYHHSEFLARLVAEGRLKPVATLSERITFHDPCYLGRQNGILDEPRQLLQIATSSSLVEMEQSGKSSFCCGGGGGMSFIDEPAGARVNLERARQAIQTDADILAVGCPFCMTQMEDGINAKRGDKPVRVMDIAEILWDSTKS